MRKILFKAKAINRDKGYHRTNYKNGDWVYGLITRLYDERFENLPAEMTDENGVSGIEIDHNTICQYTGLTDKNGNKIWENDIVWDSEERKLYKMIWCQDDMRYCVEDGDGFDYEFDSNYAIGLETNGNIFDNPELLEGGASIE